MACESPGADRGGLGVICLFSPYRPFPDPTWLLLCKDRICEYNSFPGFWESSWGVIKLDGGLGTQVHKMGAQAKGGFKISGANLTAVESRHA